MEDTHILRLRPPVWALLLAVVIGGLFYLQGKKMEARPSTPGTISVSGDARVTVSPDIAELSFGVQTGRQRTAKDAMRILETNMKKIMDAVKALGIEEKDIRTENFWLNPAYDWTESGQIPRGFEATQSLRVKVRDLDKTGAVLGAATEAGANQAGGVSFTVDDPDAKRKEARGAAIAEARARAVELATELSVSIGRLVGFSESGPGMPPILYGRAAMGGAMDSMEKAPEVPLPPGEQEIRAEVTLTYEVE